MLEEDKNTGASHADGVTPVLAIKEVYARRDAVIEAVEVDVNVAKEVDAVARALYMLCSRSNCFELLKLLIPFRS